MITPQFDVSQDDKFVFVQIRAPYIKASHIQFEVADYVLVFSLPPYYLRLRFPAKIKEDELMTSSYDLAKSLVHCKVSKMVPGEHFDDLDMPSKLLATKRQQQTQQEKPLIQEIDETPAQLAKRLAEPDFDWEIDQSLSSFDCQNVKYGFNNQYSERVGLSLHTGNEINELLDPESESSESRRLLLRQTTVDQFDAEHYAADLVDEELLSSLISFQMPSKLELDGSHKDRILKLGHREYLISNLKPTYIGIIPLVFAWAYDYRTNYGESTIESSWTVGKLVPSMCFLYNEYHHVKDAVEDCTARALSKPLYRNWKLAEKVWEDTLQIIKRGKSEILTVFSYLLEIFENDLHSVYRHIIVEDYTIWIQYASDKAINGMCIELDKALLGLNKATIYLPIEETEDLVKNSAHIEDEGDSDDESSETE